MCVCVRALFPVLGNYHFGVCLKGEANANHHLLRHPAFLGRKSSRAFSPQPEVAELEHQAGFETFGRVRLLDF